MAPKSLAEIKFLKKIQPYKDQIYTGTEDSVQEGFEYFDSPEYTQKNPEFKSKVKALLLSNGLEHFFGMLRIFKKFIRPMMKGRKECYSDLDDYLLELKLKGRIDHNTKLLESYPNPQIWQELTDYAQQNWKVTIGFTELPRQLIFKNKAVLFKYTLVCIQEMDKNKIAEAPGLEAGEEVQRVYNSLGHAANDIARWLRLHYDIKCQSNHPLGGLVNTTPLAGKAGMGWQGCNGLLITPQYGQLQRIAPIFIEEKLFEYTDCNQHRWIEEYCRSCLRCHKSCPTNAIYAEKKSNNDHIPGIGETRTCIDREKCFPQFSKTLGCSICMKVCPFSAGAGVYSRLKASYDKKRSEL